MKRKTYDAIGSLIFIAVAVAGLLECRNFSDSAALMPTFTLGAILFLSVIQLLMCSRVPDERAHINLKRMGIVLLALLLYVGYEAGRLAALAQAEQRRRRTRKGGSLNG